MISDCDRYVIFFQPCTLSSGLWPLPHFPSYAFSKKNHRFATTLIRDQFHICKRYKFSNVWVFYDQRIQFIV